MAHSKKLTISEVRVNFFPDSNTSMIVFDKQYTSDKYYKNFSHKIFFEQFKNKPGYIGEVFIDKYNKKKFVFNFDLKFDTTQALDFLNEYNVNFVINSIDKNKVLVML